VEISLNERQRGFKKTKMAENMPGGKNSQEKGQRRRSPPE
jgi:hypothetical protein